MEKFKDYDKENIGSKAYNLRKLEKKNINIPKWIVVPISMLDDFSENTQNEIMRFVNSHFIDINKFSIRSSSIAEDTQNLSYAGQFDTYLNIPKEDIIKYVQKCSNSIQNINVKEYGKNQVDKKMGVIIEQMIDAEKSGVIFTSNPIGILNELVIVCGKGIGENIVDNKVEVTTYYYNKNDKNYYYEKQEDSEELKSEEFKELIDIANKIEEIFGNPQDIEWCIKDNQIYILQSRPITTLNKKEIILDNSNIVESYPGTTLPLSISFVKEAYYRIFEKCLKRLTNNDKIVCKYKDVLKHMVEEANGRLYYRISNWYDIISFLPLKSKIIPVWQEMLGVSEKKVTTEEERRVGFWTRLKVTVNTINLLLTAPRKMEKLETFFGQVKENFKNKYKQNLDNEELLQLYIEISESLISKWDITLVNDMYAFIYTGLLKHMLKKKNINDIQVNSYITNISNLESMKPIKELVKISCFVADNQLDSELENITDKYTFFKFISQTHQKELKEMIISYIEEFGDRNLEELKLESYTFRTNPELLIKRILEYAHDDSLKNLINNEYEKTSINGKSMLIKYFSKRASIGIKNREKSRLNRSRIYGMIRTLFIDIGNNFWLESKLEEKSDIFYIRYNEIEEVIKGNDLNLKELVNIRKRRYEEYNKLPAYSRLVFDGKIVEKHFSNISMGEQETRKNSIHGTPCSVGKATGEVIIIENANYDIDVSNKIIVTKMTDPGWVFLITRAKGIISEKGSLLSHTAIISRELKKPTVVGVKDATKILKNGDIVELDGETGEINIKRKESLNV